MIHFHQQNDAIVTVSCLKHIYPDTTEIHICGLDFVVNRGERVVVLGGNGSGKTTLLYHILGLLKPNEGRVSVFGVDPAKSYTEIRERIGVLLQNVEEQILSPTAWEDVAFSPRNYGIGREETARMVDSVMQELGITRLRDKICHYLSGGEKRKVALAGALVMRPELLILDEPFEGLDTRSRAELVELLNERNREGMSIIMSTHDLNLVGSFADRVYVLARGEGVVTAGTPMEVFRKSDAFKRSNIDPPVLTELFSRLRETGITVDTPMTVDQAVADLTRLLKS
ncbi:MAG: energy-coupling factor ABC transporter ATP-binding protein [Nitrospirota bacterium]